MNTYVKGFAVAVGTTLAFGVQASYIGIDLDKAGLTNVTVPAVNDYANNPANDPELSVGQEGYGGATVLALKDGPFRLTFTYLFKEANFTNSFWYKGSEIFTTASALGSTYSTVYNNGAGPLDFFFGAQGYTANTSVTNVGNDDGVHPNFHTYWEEGSNSLIIALDDHGAGPDNNHDDMIIKITASKVPEPGTLALLGLGLAGMGLRFGKRK